MDIVVEHTKANNNFEYIFIERNNPTVGQDSTTIAIYLYYKRGFVIFISVLFILYLLFIVFVCKKKLNIK